MNKFILAISLGSMLALSSCDQSLNNGNSKAENIYDMASGFQLLQQNCFACHSPEGSFDNRIAPPMEAIKRNYIQEGISKDEFIKAISRFVLYPNDSLSMMPEAVKKFGLMPKMEFSESDLGNIANYIYETELEEPGWYAAHYKSEIKKYIRDAGPDKFSYEELGKRYAMNTKSILGKNLLGALNQKGTEYALTFCNERAIMLTDSMSGELGVKIKRVSDKPRNPNNTASELELSYIQRVKAELAQGISPEIQSYKVGDRVHAYVPITTNQMCLQCHGIPSSQINNGTLELLSELYPDDQARSYGLDELRGIWVIDMEVSQ